MPITNNGLSAMALMMVGSAVPPAYIAIGNGSSTVAVTNGSLHAELDRNQITSFDASIPKEVTYTVNFSSTEMSGITLKEMGLFDLVSGGTLWQREYLGSMVFDGSQELQIQITNKFT